MDLDQITLTQIRYAMAVAKYENFRRAADSCGVSQSGLSMQLRKLEDLLDLVLFDRTKRPVKVTSEGGKVLEQMQVVLREMERLGRVAALSDMPAGPYTLGVIPTMSSSVIPLFINTFTASYSAVELSIIEYKTEDMIEALHSDAIDGGIAAIPLHIPGIRELPLAIEPFVAYLSPDDPLLVRDNIDPSTFAQRDLWLMPEGHCFRDQSLAYCQPNQRTKPRNVEFESGHFDTIMSLVDQGLGATLLPELVAKRVSETTRARQLLPFSDPEPARSIGFLTSRTALKRRISDALCNIIKGALRSRLSRRAMTDVRVLSP